MVSSNDGILTILSGSGVLAEIDLSLIKKPRASFGRSESNDIVIPSAVVSKIHGYIEAVDGKLYIYDNNSTNGIFINDGYCGTNEYGETEMFPLSDGDIIRIDAADGTRSADKGVMILYTKGGRGSSWKRYSLIGTDRVVIGRGTGSDIRLSSIQISRTHAVVTRRGESYYISDSGSSNGTFVNGERVTSEHELHERDAVYAANTPLIYSGKTMFYKSEISGTRVVMQGVNRVVKDRKSGAGTKKILNNVNIQIEPNDFVAIIGGSGSGKTTIMNAMSGYEKATSGRVYVNSVDLYKHYKVLKNMIGYVPQQDIIYENLTLKKMLEYSARLRMPKDVTRAEIDKRIDEVLEMVELIPHRDKMIRSLSGGQKKRASIAVELLGDPGLFFLDEPTSGLDPGTEENLMKSLRNLSKRGNKTVVMVTHTTQNLHLCDKIILMGTDGNICFYGSVPECIRAFGVKSMTEVYNMISDPKDVKKWADAYYRREGVKVGLKKDSGGTVSKQKRESFIKQLAILTFRYMTLIKNDRMRLIMVFAQPLLIGILLAFVASDTVFEVYNGTKSILFALSCAGIWMGLFNSIQEICKERLILKREYMVNLRLESYIASKFLVQFIISVIQALLIVIVFMITVGSPKGVLFGNPFFELTVSMTLTIFSSAGIGLIVSSISKNSDKAMTVAPFLLIFQLLFSGILFELSGITEKISYLTVSKWSVGALGISSDLNSLPTMGGIPREFEEIFEFTASNLYKTWLVLLIFAAVCAVASGLLLRNVSNDSR